MTNDDLEQLARRAAAGDETARHLVFDRLVPILQLLDEETLNKVVHSAFSRKDGMTPELLAWLRQQVTEEEMEMARRDLQEMREKGGSELKDFIQELEQMVSRS